MTVQGVPAPAREKVAEPGSPPSAPPALTRTLAMAERANTILTDLGLEPFDPQADMVGISQYANGGGITERHLLAAMASALIRGFRARPRPGPRAWTQMGVEIPPSLAARPVRRRQPPPHVRPAGCPEGQLPGPHLHPAHRRAAQRSRGRRVRRLGRSDRHLRLPGRRVRLADGRQEGREVRGRLPRRALRTHGGRSACAPSPTCPRATPPSSWRASTRSRPPTACSRSRAWTSTSPASASPARSCVAPSSRTSTRPPGPSSRTRPCPPWIPSLHLLGRTGRLTPEALAERISQYAPLGRAIADGEDAAAVAARATSIN